MAITIDATVNGAASNSYAELEEALAYFEGRLGGATFIEADLEVQKAALLTATQRIDQEIYRGARATSEQALQWGRTGTYAAGHAIPSDIIAAFVKFAEFEEALALIKKAGAEGAKDPLAATGTEGLKSLEAGSVALVFREGDRDQDDASRTLSPSAYRLLRAYILTESIHARPGIRNFPIVR